MSKTLVIIGGPTASGKTRAGIELANQYNTEIISADSRQIYKETSIGTAVPSPTELAEVPHHFIQCISLENYYNASMYEHEVLSMLNELFKKHEIVVMVGGSGLYINAVCTGIDDLPTINKEVRKKMAAKYEAEGLASLQNMLKEVDPDTYGRIDLNNHYRVLKALEVYVQTGKPYASFLTHNEKTRDFKIIRLALNDERESLYNRINSRVDKMIESGLIEEVKGLERFRDKNAMKTVGYREIFGYLDGRHALDEAIDLIKRNTRKYARKQITWFRKNDLYRWFQPNEYELMKAYIREEISK